VSGFRKLGEEVVHRGPLISVAVGQFEAPDGSTFERDLVHHPGAVSVVPVVDEGSAVLLVRQYRAAVDRELLEIPAGKRDVVGEAPETTARRELVEEVGMRAGRLEKLAEFYNSPGFCDELSYTFLALDLEPCDVNLQGIEEQHMTIEKLNVDEIVARIADRSIVDAKTIIGLMLAREALA
jgi:ADP-ribose pyrophosphatase